MGVAAEISTINDSANIFDFINILFTSMGNRVLLQSSAIVVDLILRNRLFAVAFKNRLCIIFILYSTGSHDFFKWSLYEASFTLITNSLGERCGDVERLRQLVVRSR